MLKQVKAVGLLLAVAALIASCQNSSNDVRSAARQEIEGNAVEPAANAAPQAAAQQAAAPTGPTTTMTFEEERFDFGQVMDGEKVTHVFNFTNTGKEPLILSNARGSCGCTVPDWPRDPIAPGESGEIKVEFNTKGKKGKRSQRVTITANTDPAESFIYMDGEVLTNDTQPDVQINQ